MNQHEILELDRLLNQLADDGLSEPDEARLETMLRDDPLARDRYRRFMMLHAELQWVQGASAALVSTERASIVTLPDRIFQRSTRSSFGSPMGLAICLLTVVLVSTWTWRDKFADSITPAEQRAIMTLDTIQGTAEWRDGAATIHLARGSEQRRLAAGTLVLEGDDSSCQLRFDDGTRVTLLGDVEAEFSQDSQKRLRLRRGNLTADVARQPAGHPLLIETPTARVEVIGTLFTLVADGEQTALDVERGSVRFQRLVDGQQVEVHDQRRAVASLDASAEMQAIRVATPPDAWRQTFDQPPPAVCKGVWLAAAGEQPNRLRGVPCIASRKNTGKPIVHHGITARSGVDTHLVTLHADSVLRVRYRLAGEAPLRIMLGTNLPGGSFGGNFEVKRSSHSGTLEADGWRTLTVPLSEFQPLMNRFPKLLDGSQVSLLVFNSHEHEVGLEVRELEIHAMSP